MTIVDKGPTKLKKRKVKSEYVRTPFTKEQLIVVDSLIKGGLAKDRPDAINKIVISWLVEKNYIKPKV